MISRGAKLLPRRAARARCALRGAFLLVSLDLIARPSHHAVESALGFPEEKTC